MAPGTVEGVALALLCDLGANGEAWQRVDLPFVHTSYRGSSCNLGAHTRVGNPNNFFCEQLKSFTAI